jgi:hypothetical protein
MAKPPHSYATLNALRHIGWTYWDPIGIRASVNEDFTEGPVDEYDRYMLKAFAMLQSGREQAHVVHYLEQVAIHDMGLGPSLVGDEIHQATVVELAELVKSLT